MVALPGQSFRCGKVGDGLFVEEDTGTCSWVEDFTRYTVVHSRTVAVLFVDTHLWTESSSAMTSWTPPTAVTPTTARPATIRRLRGHSGGG